MDDQEKTQQDARARVLGSLPEENGTSRVLVWLSHDLSLVVYYNYEYAVQAREDTGSCSTVALIVA